MEYVNAATAKAIVHRDLEKWTGKLSEFQALQLELLSRIKRLTTIEKRDVFLKKNLKDYKRNFYIREVSTKFSHKLAILGGSDSPSDTSPLSKSNRQKIEKNNQVYAQHSHKIQQKKTQAIVVKDDSGQSPNQLLIMTYKTRGKNKRELLSAHSVASISKHCLERLVQRLKLNNIYEAIDEVLEALVWLEGSGAELAARSPGSYGSGFKRHIPTPNGALLLKTTSKLVSSGKPIQVCTLITWIHKKQFRKNQAVTTREFIFAQIVNSYISSPKLPDEIEDMKKSVTAFEEEAGVSKVIINISGEDFPAAQFLSALEDGQHLDFMIDFERDIRPRSNK